MTPTQTSVEILQNKPFICMYLYPPKWVIERSLEYHTQQNLQHEISSYTRFLNPLGQNRVDALAPLDL